MRKVYEIRREFLCNTRVQQVVEKKYGRLPFNAKKVGLEAVKRELTPISRREKWQKK